MIVIALQVKSNLPQGNDTIEWLDMCSQPGFKAQSCHITY